MAHKLTERTRETTTTVGTAALQLGGPVAGYTTFAAVLADGDTTYYAIQGLVNGEWEVGLGTYTASTNTLVRTTIYASSNGGAVVTLSAGSKYVFITQPAARAVWVVGTNIVAANGAVLPVPIGGTGATSSTGTGSVVLSNNPVLVAPALGTPASGVATNLTGIAAGLTAGNATNAANAAVAADVVGTASAITSINAGFLYGNHAINGACEISQINGATAVTPTASGYVMDQFNASMTQASKLTFQQVADAPAGLKNSLKISVAAQFSPGAADAFYLQSNIEGSNVIDFQLGTAGASVITLSNWIKGSIAGTYSIFLSNSAQNRSYIGTISVTTSWAQVKVTLTGDVAGTWLTDTSVGLRWQIDLGSGSNFNTTAGSWQAGTFLRTSGSVTFVNQANGSTLNITGLDFRLGSTAPTVFERRDAGEALRRCQRYLPVIRCTGSGANEPIASSSQSFGSTTACLATFNFAPVRSKITGILVSSQTAFVVVDPGTGNQTTSAISINTGSLTACVINATVPSLTLNVGNIFVFKSTATTADYIAFTGAQL